MFVLVLHDVIFVLSKKAKKWHDGERYANMEKLFDTSILFFFFFLQIISKCGPRHDKISAQTVSCNGNVTNTTARLARHHLQLNVVLDRQAGRRWETDRTTLPVQRKHKASQSPIVISSSKDLRS